MNTEESPLTPSKPLPDTETPKVLANPSTATVRLPSTPSVSLFPVQERIDLLGDAEEYTTQPDGTRLSVILENAEQEAKALEAENADTNAKLAAEVELITTYDKYLEETTAINDLRAKRVLWAKPMLFISSIVGVALFAVLRFMGGL